MSTSLVKCSKCGILNNSTDKKCWNCGTEIIGNEVIYDSQKSSSKDEESTTWLYVVGLLLPIIGMALGLIYLSKSNKEENGLGKSILICSIISAVMYLFVGLTITQLL